MKADQTVKNWRNQAVGKNFQNEIEQLAGYIPDVLLIPQWPQVQFFKGGKAKVIGEAEPDYHLFIGRLPFIFDAKTTVSKDFRPDSKHQFEDLRLAASQGIGAFYLVHWLNEREIELFHVYETDLWPVSYRRGTGTFSVSAENSWFQELTERYLRSYYDER